MYFIKTCPWFFFQNFPGVCDLTAKSFRRCASSEKICKESVTCVLMKYIVLVPVKIFRSVLAFTKKLQLSLDIVLKIGSLPPFQMLDIPNTYERLEWDFSKYFCQIRPSVIFLTRSLLSLINWMIEMFRCAKSKKCYFALK